DGERKRAFLTEEGEIAAHSIAAWACASIGIAGYAVELAALPGDRVQLEDWCSLWERDAVLYDYALLIDAHETETADRRTQLSWLLDRLHGVVAVVAERPPTTHRAALARVPVAPPLLAEHEALWRAAL